MATTWIGLEELGEVAHRKVRASEIAEVGISSGNFVVRLRGEKDWLVAHDVNTEPITSYGKLLEALNLSDSA